MTRNTPTALSPAVSRQMARMPRRNTGPELALRRLLHARGLRYRVHPHLPGRPDIAFTRVRLAVFVDGCFWHGCPIHGTLPRNNREWWQTKLADNLERDRRKDAELRALDWTVVHVWEHEPMLDAADRVYGLWTSLRSQQGS